MNCAESLRTPLDTQYTPNWRTPTRLKEVNEVADPNENI